MPRFEKLLTSLQEYSSLRDVFSAGITPDDVKKSIIGILGPHFENQTVLEELAVPALLPEAMTVAHLMQHSWAYDGYCKSLDMYHSAHTSTRGTSIGLCASWEEDIEEGLHHYWSAFQLQFASECFRTIGMLIEAGIKPHLYDLLGQLRIAKGRRVSKAELLQTSLGQVVGELIRITELADLLAPPPSHIRLNQWRNIAQHHSFRVEGNEVICRYGTEPRVSTVHLMRNEVYQVLDNTMNANRAFKSARTVFLIDNLADARPHILQGTQNLRPEQEILSFASASATQGFEVIDISITPEAAIALLHDMTTLDPNKRRFHASQLLHELWVCTQRNTISIEYREKDGTPNLISEVSGQDCDRLTRGEIDLEEFVQRTRFTNLKKPDTARDTTRG